MIEGVKNAIELSQREILINDAGGKNYNGISKKGNFDV